MELLSTLAINWQQIVAQLINFGILIAVLSYFVYRPVLRLLDERKAKVKKSMDDAAHLEKQRHELDQFRADQMKKMDQEAGVFLEKAKQQAEEARVRMIADAQKEADQLLEKSKKQLSEERSKIAAEVEASLAQMVVSLSEKVLERQFSREDQQRILKSLEKNIPSLVQ